MFASDAFKDKVILVTGGSRGIGAATVKQFAQLGASVHFCYQKNSEKAQQLVDEIEGKGQSAHAWLCDVRDVKQCENTVEKIIAQSDKIDVLINSSGIVRDGLLMSLEHDAITDVINTNLIGTMNMVRSVSPYMMRQRHGKMINVSSVGGQKPGRGQANYAASKGGVEAFTRAMAVELAKRNITVNAVAPGVIETEMSRQVRDLGGDEALGKILLKRFGKAEEVASVLIFLASEAADYITGAVIPVDGGFKMA